MKGLTNIIVDSWILCVLFSAGLCRADHGCLAPAVNNLAIAQVERSSTAPCLDTIWYADTVGDRKQSGVHGSSNLSSENNGFSSADSFDSRMGMSQPAPEHAKASANSDSPFQQYLLIVLLFGSVGLVMIAAGMAQWWRSKTLRQNWLFPAVQDEEELVTPADSAPAPLIAKKQVLPIEDEKAKKHAQRRAA